MVIHLGEGKRYTLKSFKDEADSLAAALLDLGFEKNDRFAVWLPNRSENVLMSFVASKLGLIKVSLSLSRHRWLCTSFYAGEYQPGLCRSRTGLLHQ